MITFKIKFLGEYFKVTWDDKRKQIVKSDNDYLIEYIMDFRSDFSEGGFDYSNKNPIPSDKIQTDYEAFSSFLNYVGRMTGNPETFSLHGSSGYPTADVPEGDIHKFY